MTTETIWLDACGAIAPPGSHGAEPVEMPRLSAADEFAELENFRLFVFGGMADSEYGDASAGCRVVYKDDYDASRASYQCVDATGHGDGSGEWTPVPMPGGGRVIQETRWILLT